MSNAPAADWCAWTRHPPRMNWALTIRPTTGSRRIRALPDRSKINALDSRTVIYLDSEISSLFLETPMEIDAYRNILASLDEIALDEGQSRDLIGMVALEFGEDKNDLAEEQP